MRLNFKRFLVFFYDILTIPLAWWLAYWIRQNLSFIPAYLFEDIAKDFLFIIPIQVFFFWLLGLYRGTWRFASIPDMLRIIKSVFLGSMGILSLFYFGSMSAYLHSSMPPRSIIPLYAFTLFFLLGGARLFFRIFLEMKSHKQFKENALIVGAGLAGEALIRELLRDQDKRYYPKVLVDDSPKKRGTEILGVRVLGGTKDIPYLVERYNISQILIAIPSANAKTMQNIVNTCSKLKIPYRTLPGMRDLATGKIGINTLRTVSLEDLLGRSPINFEKMDLKF